jgi:twitching motility protein PilT
VRECIGDKDRTKEIHDAISKGFTTYGMQSFDQSLMQHVKAGLVTYEEALNHVSNADDFALRFRGIESSSDATWDNFQEGDSGPKSEDLMSPEGKPGAAKPAAKSAKTKEEEDFIQKF